MKAEGGPSIVGKYLKSGGVNYFGFVFTWHARYIKDPEHRGRYVMDEDSVRFYVVEFPPYENGLSHARAQELHRISVKKAKETGYP